MKSLIEQSELESAVQISITSKTRARGENGYWGDLLGPVSCGSLLWTLDREYLSIEAEELAKQYVDDALGYLKKRGFIKQFRSNVSRGDSKMKITVEIDGRRQDVSL